MDRYYLLKKNKGVLNHVLPSENDVAKYGRPEKSENTQGLPEDKYFELEDKATWATKKILAENPLISEDELIKKSVELMRKLDG